MNYKNKKGFVALLMSIIVSFTTLFAFTIASSALFHFEQNLFSDEEKTESYAEALSCLSRALFQLVIEPQGNAIKTQNFPDGKGECSMTITNGTTENGSLGVPGTKEIITEGRSGESITKLDGYALLSDSGITLQSFKEIP